MAAGWFAEFDSPETLREAVLRLRSAGYSEVETYAPFDVEEDDPEQEGRGESWLPWIVFLGALLGAVAGYGVQWYTNAVEYPLNVGGRPAHAPLAFVYITFEALVLVAGLTAFVGFLVSLRLPALWHPVFEIDGFEGVTTDRYWLSISPRDPRFDAKESRTMLERLGARRVVRGEPDP